MNDQCISIEDIVVSSGVVSVCDLLGSLEEKPIDMESYECTPGSPNCHEISLRVTLLLNASLLTFAN